MSARVLVLYNDDGEAHRGGALERVAVAGVLGMANEIEQALRSRDWDVSAVAAPRDPQVLLGLLRESRTEVVFHCVESLGGEARFESAVAWLCELAGLAHTGSPPEAISLALDKFATKAVLAAHAVPVPAGMLLETGDEPLRGLGPGPWIVKPVREDASHGISVESLVGDEGALRARARHVIARYRQPALVEEFIEGREFNIGVLGQGSTARALPISEIDFSGLPAGHPHFLTFEAKWEEQSAVCQGSPPVPARDLGPALEGELGALARAAYRALGLRDYGRIDLRYHPQRGPFVLEANANPDLSSRAGFARAAERAGLSYVDLVEHIARAARARAARN